MQHPNVTYNDDGTVTVKLMHPKEHAQTTVESLTFKSDPSVGDMEKMDACEGKIGKTIHCISALCNVTLGLVRRLHPHDYHVLDEVAGEILLGEEPGGHPTGGTSRET